MSRRIKEGDTAETEKEEIIGVSKFLMLHPMENMQTAMMKFMYKDQSMTEKAWEKEVEKLMNRKVIK